MDPQVDPVLCRRVRRRPFDEQILVLVTTNERMLIDPQTRTTPWPGVFHDVTAQIGGRSRTASLYVRSTPGPDDAVPVVFIHGLGGSSTNWTDLATAISGQHRSHSIDLPGWGLSDPAPAGDYSLAAAGQWAAAAIEQLEPGRRVHLVGNSMGGLIALRLAALRGELVSTLTLLSPAVPGFETNTDADPRIAVLAIPGLGQRLQRRFGGDAEARAQLTIDICFAAPTGVPPERFEQAVDEVRVRSGFPWVVDAFTRSLRSLVAVHLHRRPHNPWRLARSLELPTHIIWGDRDRLVPAVRAPKLAAAISGSRLTVMQDVGHTPQLEDPEQTAVAMLDFIEEFAGGQQIEAADPR